MTNSSGSVAIVTSAAAGADGENVNLNRAANQSASLLGSALSLSAALVVVVTLPLLSVTAKAHLPANPQRVCILHFGAYQHMQ